jgi:hypothetical protein
MAQDECGCTENNCPHKTSEVTLFDGVFTNITVPAGSSLNDVLALLENYTTTAAVCNDVNYTLDAFSACLNLAAGTYSFTQIIDAMVAVMCANAGSIVTIEAALLAIETSGTIGTSSVLVEELVIPACFGFIIGTVTTSTDLFNAIMEKICDCCKDAKPKITDVLTFTAPDSGAESDPGETGATAASRNAGIEHIAEAFKSFLDNHSFVYNHSAPTVSPTSFVVEVQPMRGVVNDYLVVRKITEDLTVNASKDTYFFLSGDTTILRREVALAAPAPATPAFSHDLYKVTSDGSGVTLVTNLFTASGLNPIPLGAGDVDTVNIVDGAVTSLKMADVIVGATFGHQSIMELVINNQGQVTGATANMLLSGLSNGDILIYNSGLNRWENGDNTAVGTIGYLPKVNATADNYVDSALLEDASQVLSEKKVEINGGVAEDDNDAMLNIVGGPLLMPRLTAVAGSALPLTNGYLIYATTTDATFTSVGIWAVEAGAWVKL